MPAGMIKNKTAVVAPDELEESTGADQAGSLQKLANTKTHIDTLTKQWERIEISIRNQRLMRRLRVNTENARKDNKMQEGDIFIGVRTIDNNITMSLPTHVAYIKQSPRQAIFSPRNKQVPDDIVKEIESEFTQVMRYPAWEFDYIRMFDASECFGWGWCEVLYDRAKPGMCAVNHVGTEDLIFDLSVGNIQNSRVVLRRYRPTLVDFLELARKNGFDKKAVKELKIKLRENSERGPATTDTTAIAELSGNSITLYKVQFKEGGTVHTSWYCPSYPDMWLREPRIFWNGVKEQQTSMQVDPVTGMQTPVMNWVRVPETEYPYYPVLKKVTEDDTISETQGRGEMDQHLQQAQTSVFSAYVTQCWRSSLQLWAPKQPDTTRVGGTAPKQSQLKVVGNALWDQPMESFTPEAPDSTMPLALDKLATANADNLNQPAFTVANRQNDSRKTAKEIEVASQQGAQVSSTQVVVSSVCISLIQNASWRIVQSQALQGNITFMSLDGTPAGNQTEIIQETFILKPAGDVDFIERQETEQKMQQDWEMVSMTPMAMPFMTDYLRLRYPNRAEGWIKTLQAQGSPEKQALAALVPIVETLMTDDDGNLEPEVQPMAEQLQQILETAKQLISGGMQQNGLGTAPTSPAMAQNPANSGSMSNPGA